MIWIAFRLLMTGILVLIQDSKIQLSPYIYHPTVCVVNIKWDSLGYSHTYTMCIQYQGWWRVIVSVLRIFVKEERKSTWLPVGGVVTFPFLTMPHGVCFQIENHKIPKVSHRLLTTLYHSPQVSVNLYIWTHRSNYSLIYNLKSLKLCKG